MSDPFETRCHALVAEQREALNRAIDGSSRNSIALLIAADRVTVVTVGDRQSVGDELARFIARDDVFGLLADAEAIRWPRLVVLTIDRGEGRAAALPLWRTAPVAATELPS